MKKLLLAVVAIMLAATSVKAQVEYAVRTGHDDSLPASSDLQQKNTPLRFRFASQAEGRMLKLSDTTYYNRLTQMDIDWRMQKENATVQELMAYSCMQISDFTPEEQKAVSRAMAIIQDSLNAIGCSLPLPEELVFVKTTMKDEREAAAYTTGNQIFLSNGFLVVDTDRHPQAHTGMVSTLAHELFHCISRNSPAFRQKMYSLIGFTVMDREIVFPDSIRARIAANPDVEKYDSYGTFTINGQHGRYTLVSVYDKTWAESQIKQPTGSMRLGSGRGFLRNIEFVLFSLDDFRVSHSLFKLKKEQMEDFWAQVGDNTLYIFAPEEIMAENFSKAIVSNIPKGKHRSPWLLQNIVDALRQF